MGDKLIERQPTKTEIKMIKILALRQNLRKTSKKSGGSQQKNEGSTHMVTQTHRR